MSQISKHLDANRDTQAECMAKDFNVVQVRCCASYRVLRGVLALLQVLHLVLVHGYLQLVQPRPKLEIGVAVLVVTWGDSEG